MIEFKRIKKDQVIKVLPLLLKVISKNDEFLLLWLFNSYLFNKKFTADKIPEEDLVYFKQMYLSYCLSET